MTTVLDTPIVHGQTVDTQKIENINLRILEGVIEVDILDFLDTGQEYTRKTFRVNFSDIPEGTVKDNFRAILGDIRTFARNKGVLEAGTDTDDI